MRLRSAVGIVVPLVMGLSAVAQHQSTVRDSSSLRQAFRNAQIHGHLRYYFMATDNAGELTDYYANAAGGGIKYQTAAFKGFQMAVSGSFACNLGSADLSRADARTGQTNRYEIGLFDLQNPSNKKSINRLEELNLRYSSKQLQITAGRQLINTPFINPQDGRMWPTAVNGVYAVMHDSEETKIEGGYLYQISPRSTIKWFTVGESIGLYPTGVSADGTKSGYSGQLETRGVGVLGITHKIGNSMSLKAWNLFAENIFNAALVQVDYNKSNIVAGLQYIRQDAVNDGGNHDQSKTYFRKGTHSQVFGVRLGRETFRWQTTLNYTRITATGRYLMPREWGRDPFFTFLPRERNEGLGDVHAFTTKFAYAIPKAGLKIETGIGYYHLPEVINHSLNKYGLPSYAQVNLDLRYQCKGALKGLESQLLYVYKGKLGSSYGNDKYVVNKVDMSSFNLVFNYNFLRT